MAAASASASSAGAISSGRKHAFDAGDGDFHAFLQTLSSQAEKETAMVAKRWTSFPPTIGLEGDGFELLRNHPGAPIQFRILWAASDPDLQATFKTSCPKGIWITVSMPRACPYEAPTFTASCEELRGPIPSAALCKAVSKVCNDRSLKICQDSTDADGGFSAKAWPVKSALGMLDKGIGTILSVLGSRLGGKRSAGAASSAPAPASASAPAPASASASASRASPAHVSRLPSLHGIDYRLLLLLADGEAVA
jgi:hypothetical protein